MGALDDRGEIAVELGGVGWIVRGECQQFSRWGDLPMEIESESGTVVSGSVEMTVFADGCAHSNLPKRIEVDDADDAVADVAVIFFSIGKIGCAAQTNSIFFAQIQLVVRDRAVIDYLD